MSNSRPPRHSESDLITRLDDSLYDELIALTDQQIVHAAVWEDSLLDALDSRTTDPETQCLFDIDIYLADGVFFELYGTLCYQSVEGEPLCGLAKLSRIVASKLDTGLWLEDIAADGDDNLVLVLSHAHDPVLFCAVGAWSLREWSELPSQI